MTIEKTTVVEDHEPKSDVTTSIPRRSARLATRSFLTIKQKKEPLGTYHKMFEVAQTLPWTEATTTRKIWPYNYALAETANLGFLPGYRVDEAKETFQRIEMLPQHAQAAAFEKAFKTAFEKVFAGTFGFHGPHTSIYFSTTVISIP